MWLGAIFGMGLFSTFVMLGQAQDYKLEIKALEAQVYKTYCKGEIAFRMDNL